MIYLEALPLNCPPETAVEVTTVTSVYRLIAKGSPEMEDFRSHRALYPAKRYPNECIARGLSVFRNESDAESMLLLKKFLGKGVCRVKLSPNAGRLTQQKSNHNSHSTWWPYATFDILSNCESFKA